MVWFNCNSCGDVVKKPKLAKHFGSCAAASFTCIDCQLTFSRSNVHKHTSCVTEQEKYIQGATKPGGIAAKGFTNSSEPQKVQSEVEGIAYLSQQPPWICSLCNVSCTCRENLMSHARSKSHKKKVKRTTVSLDSKGDQPKDSKSPQAGDSMQQGSKAAVEVVPHTDTGNKGNKNEHKKKKAETLDGRDTEGPKKKKRKRADGIADVLESQDTAGMVTNGGVVKDSDVRNGKKKKQPFFIGENGDGTRGKRQEKKGKGRGRFEGVSDHFDGSHNGEICKKIRKKRDKKGVDKKSSKHKDGSAEFSILAKEKKRKHKKEFAEMDTTSDGDLKGVGVAKKSEVNGDADESASEAHQKAKREKKRRRKQPEGSESRVM